MTGWALQVALAAALVIAVAEPVRAINYSVPYVRQGLPYTLYGYYDLGYSGYGAIVGEVEVRGTEGNGIDGFNSHRQSGLGGDPISTNYGFQDVANYSGTGTAADSYFHGTFVAGIMASQYIAVTTTTTTGQSVQLPFLGVAPMAKYYGAVFSGESTKAGFLSLNSSLNYVTITSGASVVNHSWGGDASQSDLTGSFYSEPLLMDEYAGYYGKTAGTTGQYRDKLMVIAAGNNGGDSGSRTGLLGTPADSYNGLVVGALGVINTGATALADTGRTPTATVASYSSWKPLANGRAGVDVVAPGTNIWSTLAIDYQIGPDNTTGNDRVAGAASGTSFATPHVTGVAAVLYGIAANSGYSVLIPDGSGSYTFYVAPSATERGTTWSTDHKVIKAIIMNSADKIAGLDINGIAQSSWQPGQVITTDGVTNAVVPLNYAVGTGSVNAQESVLQYSETGNRFWDLNQLQITDSHYYYTFGTGKFISTDPTQPLLTNLTATLVWDRHVDFTVNENVDDTTTGEASKDVLSNLDLILQKQVSPGVWQDVYMSAGTLDNVEHIYLTDLSASDIYRLDVYGEYIAEPALGEQYALAVSWAPVPEPATIVAIVGLTLCAMPWTIRRWRRWRQTGASLRLSLTAPVLALLESRSEKPVSSDVLVRPKPPAVRPRPPAPEEDDWEYEGPMW